MYKITVILFLLTTVVINSQELKVDWGKALGSRGYDYPYCTSFYNEGIITIAYFEDDSIFIKDSYDSHCSLISLQRGTYIIEFDSEGTIINSKKITPNNFIASSIAIKNNNEIFIAGNYKDTLKLNTPYGLQSLFSKGGYDFCLIKMNNKLEVINHITLGNEYEDRVHDLILQDESILLAGFTSGDVDLNPEAEEYVLKTDNTLPSGFLIKLTDQFELEWAQHYYNNKYAQCKAIALDNEDNIILTGYFYDNLNIRSIKETYQIEGNGRLDLFVSKINKEGELIWAKNWGYAGYDSAEDIVSDEDGNIYVAASLEVEPILENWHTEYYEKVFRNQATVLKLDTNGNQLWRKSFAGPYSSASATSITLDNLNQPIIAGYSTLGADMNPGEDEYYFSTNREEQFNECGFIEALDSNGNFIWATQFASKGTQNENIYLGPKIISNQYNKIICINSSYKAECEGADIDNQDNHSNIELISITQCYPIYVSMYDTACQSYITSNGDTLYSSGSFTEELSSIHTGCDSIVTWYITIHPSFYIEKDTTIFEGTDMIVAGEYFTNNETYTESLTCQNTYCDSTVVWHITVSDSIIFSAITSEPACENSELTIYYSLFSGIPNKYRVIFDEKGIQAGFKNTKFVNFNSYDNEGEVSIFIPDSIEGGTYTAYLQFKNSNGSLSFSSPFKITVNISSKYIHFLYEDLMMFDNSSENFKEFQWYKNGELIKGATDQFFYDDLGSLGYYHVRAITTEGDTLITCPKYANPLNTDSKNITITPNPVPKNSKCTIEFNGFSSDNNSVMLTIKAITGQIVHQSEYSEQPIVVSLPSQTGLYLGYITYKNNNSYYFKIIRN